MTRFAPIPSPQCLALIALLGLAACGAAGPPVPPSAPLDPEEVRTGPSEGPLSGPPRTTVDISGTASMGVSGSL